MPGARRIPDPTTPAISAPLQSRRRAYVLDIVNDVRLRAWAEQPDEFFEQARIDADGTLVGTTGACKQGMDIAYNGTWGYHPLVVSLANTGEVMSIVNRSGNRPSHEGAAVEVDRAIRVCRPAASAESWCAATPTSPRPSISIAGMPTSAIHLRRQRDGQPAYCG